MAFRVQALPSAQQQVEVSRVLVGDHYKRMPSFTVGLARSRTLPAQRLECRVYVIILRPLPSPVMVTFPKE